MATIPPLPVPGGDVGVWATELNAALTFLRNPPHAQLIQTAAQSIPNGADTLVSMATAPPAAVEDSDGMFTAATTLTVQTAGVWALTGGVRVTGSTAGYRYAQLVLAGSQGRRVIAEGAPDTAGIWGCTLHLQIRLAVGDTVQLMATQNSGAALNTDPTYTFLATRWVGV